MKRTALQRKTPLRAKTGLQTRTPLKAKKPMSRTAPIKKKATKRKSTESRWANESYLAFVRKLPCSGCGATPGGDAHHAIGIGHFSGVGLKAPDSLTMPLCRTCHDRLHAAPAMWPEQWGWMYATLHCAMNHWPGAARHYQQLESAAAQVLAGLMSIQTTQKQEIHHAPL